MDASVLTKKIGPLPVWAYGAGVGAIALLLSRRSSGSKPIAGDYAMRIPTNGVGNIVGDNGAGDGDTAPHLPPLYKLPSDKGASIDGGSHPYAGDPYDIPGWKFNPLPDVPAATSPINPATGKPYTFEDMNPSLPISKPTDIPSIKSIPVLPSPSAGAAAGTSTKTFADSIADFAKSIGTPLAVVGNYFTADPTTKPSFASPTTATVPGIPGMTQGATLADVWAKSQADIASSPKLQQQIANANVQESQRKNAVVGEGGTLVFLDPTVMAKYGIKP